MTLAFLNRKEIKPIITASHEQWEADMSNWMDEYFFTLAQKDKISMIHRDLEKIDFSKLRINSLGTYIGVYANNEMRLSIEGSQLIAPHATKNIVEITLDEVKQWLRGEDLAKEAPEGYVILRYDTDILGCGKTKEGKILNFVPKAR